MDVGANEFEQSLPLLQELVLGADFVGTARAFRALSPAAWAGGACGGCGVGGTGRRGPASGRLGRGRLRLEEGPAGGQPSQPGRRAVKQQLPS